MVNIISLSIEEISHQIVENCVVEWKNTGMNLLHKNDSAVSKTEKS